LHSVASLAGHSERIWNIAWSPNGKLLASCGGDKSVRIWGQDGNEKWFCKGILEETHQRTIRRVDWSPCGKYLACSSFDATISIWERKENDFECIATLEGHENEVKSIVWHSNGTLLASCSRDKSVWIWESTSDGDFECISLLQSHTQDVKMIAWHPIKELLISCSYDDKIKIWEEDSDDWVCSSTLSAHTSTVWEVSFDKEGNRFASCSDDLNLIVWGFDSERGKWDLLCSIQGYHRRCIYSVDWAKTNNLISTGSGDDCIRIFQVHLSSGTTTFEQLLCQEKAHSSDVNCVRWHPLKENILASCGDDNLIKIWEVSSQNM